MGRTWWKSTKKNLIKSVNEKRPLRRPRLRREDNIKMDLREIAYVYKYIHVVQDRGFWWDFVNTIMNLWVSYNTGMFLSG
jgi:hypothetical protein